MCRESVSHTFATNIVELRVVSCYFLSRKIMNAFFLVSVVTFSNKAANMVGINE